MHRLVATGVALGLAGCASGAPEVAVTYVSLVNYESYTCAQLGREAERAYAQGAGAAQDGAQSSAISATKAPIVVPWPAASLGKGPGAYRSQLGTVESIERASVTKKCALKFQHRTDPSERAIRAVP